MSDEAGYAYVAQGILAGEVPYRDMFDHKTPVIYYIYATIFRVFGATDFFLRFCTMLWAMATAIFVFLVGRKLLEDTGGLISAFLYAVFSSGVYVAGSMSNSENFMVLFLLIALYFFLGSKNKPFFLVLAGVFSGLAFMTKQVAIYNFLVLVGFLLIEGKKGLKDLLWLTVGFLVFPVAFSLYFLTQGAFSAFINCAYIFNFYYIQSFSLEFFALRIASIAALGNLILWLLSIIAAFLILLKDRDRNLLLLLCWTLFMIFGVCTGGFYFNHYFFILIPSLCLLSSYTLLKWIKARFSLWVNAIFIILIILLLCFTAQKQLPFFFKYSPEEISFNRYGQNKDLVVREIGLLIKSRVKPDQYILARYVPQGIYYYSRARYPGRYFFGVPSENKVRYHNSSGKLIFRRDFYVRLPKELVICDIKEQKDALRNKKTKYVVYKIPPQKFNELRQYFKEFGFYYVPSLSKGEYRVFERRAD